MSPRREPPGARLRRWAELASRESTRREADELGAELCRLPPAALEAAFEAEEEADLADLATETARLLAAVPRREPPPSGPAPNPLVFPEIWVGHSGPELVLAIARYVGARLRRHLGQPVILLPGRPAARLPSTAARRYLAALCEEHTGRVPSLSSLRRAMDVLIARAEESKQRAL